MCVCMCVWADFHKLHSSKSVPEIKKVQKRSIALQLQKLRAKFDGLQHTHFNLMNSHDTGNYFRNSKPSISLPFWKAPNKFVSLETIFSLPQKWICFFLHLYGKY